VPTGTAFCRAPLQSPLESIQSEEAYAGPEQAESGTAKTAALRPKLLRNSPLRTDQLILRVPVVDLSVSFPFQCLKREEAAAGSGPSGTQKGS